MQPVQFFDKDENLLATLICVISILNSSPVLSLRPCGKKSQTLAMSFFTVKIVIFRCVYLCLLDFSNHSQISMILNLCHIKVHSLEICGQSANFILITSKVHKMVNRTLRILQQLQQFAAFLLILSIKVNTPVLKMQVVNSERACMLDPKRFQHSSNVIHGHYFEIMDSVKYYWPKFPT